MIQSYIEQKVIAKLESNIPGGTSKFCKVGQTNVSFCLSAEFRCLDLLFWSTQQLSHGREMFKERTLFFEIEIQTIPNE